MALFWPNVDRKNDDLVIRAVGTAPCIKVSKRHISYQGCSLNKNGPSGPNIGRKKLHKHPCRRCGTLPSRYQRAIYPKAYSLNKNGPIGAKYW